MSRLGKTEAIRRLNDALNTARALQGPRYNVNSPEFEKWRRNTRVAIKHIFDDEKYVEEFSGVHFYSFILNPERDRSEYIKDLKFDLKSAIVLLESMVDEIENYWPDDDQPQISSGESDRDVGGSQMNKKFVSNAVFLIHGRDNSAKESVARFLQKIGIEVVILDEQPSRGRTIIEKFEDHADVGFAVALLTPDDRGSLQDERSGGAPRARQNVIFELGFFVAHLGRERVCALIKGNAMEIPSDYSGVVYITLDDGRGWQLALIKELKSAGLDVDANRAL